MRQTFEFFNFGHGFIQWISVLNRNASLFYKMVFSLDFGIDRGCRQGDATSLYNFNLCIDLIRQNRNIKRIKIGKETVCLLEFADDTVISLEGYEKMLKSAPFLSFYKIFRSKTKVLLNQSQKDWVQKK